LAILNQTYGITKPRRVWHNQTCVQKYLRYHVNNVRAPLRVGEGIKSKEFCARQIQKKTGKRARYAVKLLTWLCWLIDVAVVAAHWLAIRQ